MQDHYLLSVLEAACNGIPDTEKCISDMSEKELSDLLVKWNSLERKREMLDIHLPSLSMQSSPHCEKSKTLILPLSLENNATTTGTAAIIEEFGNEFGIPCEHAKQYLPFDEKNKVFNIDAARKHHEFLFSLHEHKKEMIETVRILNNAEKALDSELIEDQNHQSSDDCTQTNKQKVNAKFNNVCKNIVQRMWEAQQGNEEKFERFIDWLDSNENIWENVKDYNGRTLLHDAVESENFSLVKTLVCAGVNINAKERCGATALTIAVIKNNEEISKFLLENFAIFGDYFFPSIPSPHAIAKKLELEVSYVMDKMYSEERTTDSELWKAVQNEEDLEEPGLAQDEVTGMDVGQEDGAYNFNRKSTLTLFVGDQGTNKIMRGVKGRSEAAYGWCAEVPGDLHTKGYLYEVCKKVMTPGGFMHIVQDVLLRRKIVPESFGKKKFQQQNLSRIEEAVRDISFAFGMAACIEFQKSPSFPEKSELQKCKRATGNHNEILLAKFKKWVSCNKQDAYFQYYSQMFTLFGPLQQMYLTAVKYGDGLAREAVWMIMYPLFTQSNKRNYATEAMVHILNFTAHWPLSVRELLKKNCSVSLNGKAGHNIALDEWVEMCIVQPMKNYSTGAVYSLITEILAIVPDEAI